MADRQVDILIIGGGLTGAALMLALRGLGFNTLLVEAKPFSDKVNPDFDKYKFVDFISNSMPSPFAGFNVSNFAVLKAIMEMKDTYRTILGRFGSFQKAVVMGEEDNNWPKPF